MHKSPVELVQQLSAFHFISRALHVAGELGVADAVATEEATPLADVARETGADEDALTRALRLLAAHGVFALEGASVRHTPASELLRTGHPASLRDFVRMFGLPVMWRTAEGLAHSMRTGEAAVPQVFPDGGFWGYLAGRPEEARVFDAAMAQKACGQIGSVLAAHDFARYRSVSDVGGGQGHLLRALLAAHPGLNGVLFDLPHVIEAARAGDGPVERLTFQAGDFFKDRLPRCDAYVLMEVLHDWADPPAQEIVSAVRRAASPEARLLVVETVIPEVPGPSWPKTLDIVMLGLFAGRQRTAGEYRRLLRAGGFELTSETDTGAGISVFEAEPI